MHTKGPWRVMDLGDGYRIVSAIEDKQIIASIYFRDDETPANARLIASAPGLLKALKRVASWDTADSDCCWVCGCGNRTDIGHLPECFMPQVAEAIAKGE